MLDLFQLLDDACQGLRPLVTLVKGVLGIIQFAIPILLILLGTIDLGKAVISSDDKEVKASQSRLIKRCIYAVAIFFVATLVSLIMRLVANGVADDTSQVKSNTSSWAECWNS